MHLRMQLSFWCLLVLFVGGAIDRCVTGLAFLVFVIRYKHLLAKLVCHMSFVMFLLSDVTLSVQVCVRQSERKEISTSCIVFCVDIVRRLLLLALLMESSFVTILAATLYVLLALCFGMLIRDMSIPYRWSFVILLL